MAHRDKGPVNQCSMFMLVYYIFFPSDYKSNKLYFTQISEQYLISNLVFIKAFKINEKLNGNFSSHLVGWSSVFRELVNETIILMDQPALTAEKAKQASKQGWAIWPKNNIKIYFNDLNGDLLS